MGEAASAAEPVVAKSEFARICNVTPGRVSQWIGEGKISGDALVGEGRSARVDVAIAQQQLRRHIDIGQRFGNGMQTRLEMAPPLSSTERLEPQAHGGALVRRQAVDAPPDPYEEAMRGEKLREIQFRNRDAAEKELARRGIYTRTDEVQAAMGGLATGMLNVFEGALTDLAAAIATRFELPQRDVLHLLRTEFRGVRAKAASVARRRAQGMAALVADEVADAADAPEAEPPGEA